MPTRKSSQHAQTSGHPWRDVAVDCWLLGAEAAIVVPLRLFRLAQGGPEACREARLMVTEKIEAHSALVGNLVRGRLGRAPAQVAGGVVTHYLDRVRANRVRLAKQARERR